MDNDKKNTCCKKNCCRNNSYRIEIDRGAIFSENQDGGAEAVAIESGYKLHSSNWLEDSPEVVSDDIFEVRFKNTRRGYYYNVNKLSLKKGDIVAVESSPGHDIGIISLTGDLVARQMKRVGFNPQNGEFKKIYRKAKPYDIEKWQEAISLEHDTMIRSRQYAAQLGLNMKIGDVEYQGDKIKAIFYYIADERVDFRELIKVFAEQFKIRVEMKQIGARQEAGRIGGLGSCGREQCCSSWISSFVSVTTNTARTQDISLNPQKLAGQCGKLKCCLTYEFDSYMDARRELPRVNQPLQILDGNYFLVKTDILSHTMWFSTDPHSLAGMKPLPASRVREIQKLNNQGIKPDTLEAAETTSTRKEREEPGFMNAMGEESITRFDRNRSGGGRGNGRNRNNRNKGGNQRAEQTAQGGGEQKEQREQRSERGEQQPRRNNRSNQDRNNRQNNKASQDKANQNQGSGEKPERTPRAERAPRTERAPRPERVQKEQGAQAKPNTETAAEGNTQNPRRDNGNRPPRGANNRSRGGQRRSPRPSGDASQNAGGSGSGTQNDNKPSTPRANNTPKGSGEAK